MTTKNVELLSPIPFAGTTVTQLAFRPPKMKEYAAFGEPVIQTRGADGSWILVENTDAIFSYARGLLAPEHVGILDHVGLADTLRVKDVILDFFADARSAGETAAPDSSSPSLDGSASETSAI